jgi:uncharacterized membrane protein
MIPVTLYSRSDCHLCEEVIQSLNLLQGEFPTELTVVDIASSAELTEKYGLEIPVVEIGVYVLKAPISLQELRLALDVAKNSKGAGSPASTPLAKPGKMRTLKVIPATPVGPETWTTSDRFSYWLARHYLGLLNGLLILFLGLPFLAPVLMKIGWEPPARVIYRAYSATCHQLAFRSFFLFGEQQVYPRAAAGLAGEITYGQATGLGEGNSPEEILAARNFVGSGQMGYKIALCERDVAIYGSILIFNFLFILTKRRIPPLKWYWWVLLGLVPIGLDGVSQLLSQPPLGFIPFRESTPFLRLLTGFLFGFTTAWFGVPLIEESMAESKKIYAARLLRLKGPASKP